MPKLKIGPAIALSAMVLALAAAVVVPRLGPPSFHGTYLTGSELGRDFTLEAADRGAVSLSDFRGRAVLLFFGYTSCPDVCPLTMAKLDRAMELLGDRRQKVQVLMVTVDPELDRPQELRAYLQSFDLGFIGLTGERALIEEIAGAYGAYAGEPATGGIVPAEGDPAHAGHGASSEVQTRLIPHTSHVFGIDRAGRTRLLWGPDVSAEQIARDVRGLLRL